MGVQACRLPALKPLKPLKPLKRLKPLKPLKTLPQRMGRPTAQLKTVKTLSKRLGCPNRAGISYPKARSIVSSQRGPRQQAPQGPQQWLLRPLMGVQACRLPALKPLKPLKRLKPLKPLKLLKLCHSVWDAQPRSLKPLKLLSIRPSVHPSIHPSISLSLYLSYRTPQIGGVGGTRGASPFYLPEIANGWETIPQSWQFVAFGESHIIHNLECDLANLHFKEGLIFIEKRSRCKVRCSSFKMF